MRKKTFYFLIILSVIVLNRFHYHSAFASLGDYTGTSFDTAGSGNAAPAGITSYDDFFWITDLADDEVYKYDANGTYVSVSFDTFAAGASNPTGITGYDDFLWVLDSSDDEVYKYNLSGTYQSFSFDLAASGNAGSFSIDFQNGFFWVWDVGDFFIYKYNPDGTYTGSYVDLSAFAWNNPTGMEYYNGYFWISDDDDAQVYQFDENGTYTGVSFDTAVAGNDDLFGDFTEYQNYFWIVDAFTDAQVYKYEGNLDAVAPTISALSPLDEATEIAVGANLVITFDEDVNVETGNISIFKSDDTLIEAIDVTGLLVTGDGTDTITINPSSDLEQGEAYYIQVDATAFDDLAGNSFAGIADETTWNFSTVSPSVITSSGSSRRSQSITYSPPPSVLPIYTSPPYVPTPYIPSAPLPPPPISPAPSSPVDSSPSNSSSAGVKEEISNPVSEEEIKIILNIEKVAKEVTDFVKSEVGEVTTKTVTITGLAVGVAVTFFSNVSNLADVGSHALELWSFFLYGIGLKRRNRPWGVVYDSVTKQPLDPAYVVLKNLEGKEVASAITDLDGRFGFLVDPGVYSLVVSKTNYHFPSEKLSGKNSDELYSDIYWGDYFEIKEKGEVVARNVPLDKINFDWNEFAKRDQSKMKFYHAKDLFVGKLSNLIFALGFLVSALVLFTVIVPYNIIIFSIYVLLFFLRKARFNKSRKGSVVNANTEVPLSYGILRIYSILSGKEVSYRVLDQIGNYYCLIPNGTYIASIEKKNPDMSYTRVYTSPRFEVKHGILKKRFRV
ncbi:hypothetical protein A2914_02355 [Candidatus Nomurabacteria bacterium RIFCSPLOWO2_01_FULL_41_21]|uniref:SbsA Ig-like domain-containing protein n=1 Tax=Candidatus Nomurabacteria bacterium RIFCSPLOWO2_01_FULL_41_21 TaxID=1801776 RepID=A0A1F6X2U0_9BACT|nr:MAG: hypothetical protein A2914_02355 [Candidatus Nomurabacteria bacterium RIFCSPLOWO2_01_FULL_41_21]